MVGNFAVLGHRQQDLIDRWLLAGKSVRWVASQTDPPVSFGAIQRYRKRLLSPALKRVAAKLNGVANLPVATVEGDRVVQRPLHEVTSEVNADERVNAFVERVNDLWLEARQGVRDARSAVRMHRDADGNVVIDGRDFGALAAMLGQAHKNTELFGKATGLLNDQPAMNLNVVMPAIITTEEPGAPAPREEALTLSVDPEEFPPRSS